MRNLVLLFIYLITINLGFSQKDFQIYREDQIYFSLYYNSLGGKFDSFKENKFSSSFNIGFIRDVPLSSSGKFALGFGAGIGFNSFNNNMKLSSSSILSFELLPTRDIPKKNTFTFSEIQFPLEIRWRNSSISNYKFWRIYAGFKYSRILQSSYKFESYDENYNHKNLPINLDQLGFTLNICYNTWNIGLYKSLRPFFNKNLDSFPQELEQFKLGLIFYIL